MFQILMQLPTMIATVIILYLHSDRKKLNFKDEVLFFHVVFFNLIISALEEGILAVTYYSLPSNVLMVLNVLYGLFVVLEFYLINRYLYVRLNSEFRVPGKVVNVLPMVIYIAIVVIFPIEAEFKSGTFFYMGIPVWTLGIIMIYYGVMASVRVVGRAFFEKKSHKTVVFYSFFAILSGFTLIFARGALFTGTLMCLVIWVLYCRFDNPEQYLDHTVSAFNHDTFYLVMSNMLQRKKDCALITFSLQEFPMLTEVFGVKAVESLMDDVIQYFSLFSGKLIFRLETNLFCLCLESKEDSFEAVNAIIKRFEDNWELAGLEVKLKPALTYYRGILDFDTAGDLAETVTFFAVEGRRNEDTPVLIVDNELLNDRRKFLEMQRIIEKAVSDDDIEVFYQPIYKVSSGRFVGLEALARLRLENGELLEAEEFINYAEDGCKIVKLGDVVFRKVCRFARSFDFEATGIEYISVNLSRAQCLQKDMAYKLNLLMSEYSIPPYRIRFETTRPDNAAVIVSNLRELVKCGSGITLDKCSIGFSGRFIKNDIRFSIVKLDLSLLEDYINSQELMKPLEDTVNMLHYLHLEVAVSSVGNMEQYSIVKGLGVDYIQGFYLSDVLPPDKVQKFIKEWL